MSYWKIAWRNMQERALASSLTGLSMALGIALMVLVLVIHEVFVNQLSNDAQGYNFIIGGNGSPYEVVLTTVFHVGKPLYPIPYRIYKKFIDDGEFAPYTDLAVPVCLGDSYSTEDGQRFRVVGTTPEMFDKLAYGAEKDGTEKFYRFQSGGRNFKSENFFEAVLGSVVANRTGLKVGDTFRPTHGISGEGDKHDEFTVVGILEPTGTSNDRALFINIEGFYLLAGHARAPKEGAAVAKPAASIATARGESHVDHPAPLPEDQREITSILVRCKQDQLMAPMAIEMGVNKGEDRSAQAVAPVNVVERLKESFLAPMRMVLLVLTVMIVVVAGISILVSIYNSMSERSHDIAVMRALGASRQAVMAVILVESILLSLLGGAAGLLLGHGVLAAASPIVEFYTGITVKAWEFTWQELLLVPGLVSFAALVGFLPAVSAYRTDVAKTLGGGR
jgi:putative ABC transport system permease protein